MKIANLLIVGAASVVLGGCAGFSAYVPNAGAGSSNNAICAPINYTGFSIVEIDIDASTDSEVFSFTLSDEEADGPETGTISFSNLPPGVSVSSINPNPFVLTVESGSATANFNLNPNDVDAGTYNVTIRITRPGCSDYTIVIPFDVDSDGNQEA